MHAPQEAKAPAATPIKLRIKLSASKQKESGKKTPSTVGTLKILSCLGWRACTAARVTAAPGWNGDENTLIAC